MATPYLSYSGFKKYECQFAYWNEYVNKTVLSEADNRLGSIFGIVIGLLFERFYRDKMWRLDRPQEALSNLVDSTLSETLKKEVAGTEWRKGGVLKWKGDAAGQDPHALYATKEELAEDIREALDRGLRIIRLHRLVGPQTDTEVKLDTLIEGYKIAGRADFILTRVAPDSDLVILDGKGSRHRDKYTSEVQLMWYAMLFKVHEKRLPDKLGFVYWRSDPKESLDWVNFTESDIDELQARVVSTVSEIASKTKSLPVVMDLDVVRTVFLPNANDDNCRFCSYAIPNLCPKGYEVREQLEERARQKELRKKARAV